MKGFLGLFLALMTLSLPSQAHEVSYKTISTPRFTLHIDNSSKKPLARKTNKEEISEIALELLDTIYEEVGGVLEV